MLGYPTVQAVVSPLFVKGFPREKIKELCNLDAPIPETDKLRSRDKEYVQSIREGYRRRRVVSKLKLQFPMSILETEEEQSLDETRARLAALWNQQPVEVLLGNRNLPPLINSRAIDPRTVKTLNLVTDIAGNLGGVCFIVGSFAFYEEYDAPTFGSVLFAVGSLLFFTGSVANFIKNDAWSGRDVALSINAWLYLFANFLFIIGSIAFVPAVEEELGGTDLGISLFIIGSVIFIVAPGYDMYRARTLRGSAQISYLSFVIESTIAALYIGGSCLFVVGSVYFFPALYDEFAVTLFVVGSFFFFAATISSPLANLWRYVNTESNLKFQHTTTEEIKRRALHNVGDKGRIRKKKARSISTREVSAATDYFARDVGDLVVSRTRRKAPRTVSLDSSQKFNVPATLSPVRNVGADIELGVKSARTKNSAVDESPSAGVEMQARHSEGGYLTSAGVNWNSGGMGRTNTIGVVFRAALLCDVDVVDA